MGVKIQELRSIVVGIKLDRERLRIVWEMEKSKNLHARPMDMTKGGTDAGERGSTGQKGANGKKLGQP